MGSKLIEVQSLPTRNLVSGFGERFRRARGTTIFRELVWGHRQASMLRGLRPHSAYDEKRGGVWVVGVKQMPFEPELSGCSAGACVPSYQAVDIGISDSSAYNIANGVM